MNGKVAIYIRVGRESQLEREEDQQKLCERFLEGSEYEVYKDAGSGMKSPLPSLQKLLTEVRMGMVSKVICAAPSVLTREFAVMADIADQFKEAKVPLIRADKGVDLVNDVELSVSTFLAEVKSNLK